MSLGNLKYTVIILIFCCQGLFPITTLVSGFGYQYGGDREPTLTTRNQNCYSIYILRMKFWMSLKSGIEKGGCESNLKCGIIQIREKINAKLNANSCHHFLEFKRIY